MGEVCKVVEFQDHMELPLGAVIHGTVTVGGDKKDAICRVDEISTTAKNVKKTDISHADKDDSLKTAKYFLCKWQRLLNGGSDTIGEEGVTVERIDFPDRSQTLKLVDGAGWSTLDENTEGIETPSAIVRLIDYCRCKVEKFCGV